jgi:hypothetical protein
LPPRQRQIQLTFKPWLLSKIAVLKWQRLLGGSSLNIAFRQAGAQCLVGNVSMGVFAQLSLKNSEQMFFFKLHNISHPGRLAGRRMISGFVWGDLSRDVNTWVRSCLHCQQSSTAMPACCCSTALSLNSGLLISALIWWDLHIKEITAIMSSLSLIAYPNGWKFFPCLITPLGHAHWH